MRAWRGFSSSIARRKTALRLAVRLRAGALRVAVVLLDFAAVLRAAGLRLAGLRLAGLRLAGARLAGLLLFAA